MENFVVSARKYRPSVFTHVVGQEPITITLKNAIRDKHLAQAFLFCGPRGVGKTTCARILAKAINCQNLTADIEPCNACTACTNFNQQRSFNIYELDAASNNSVEDIRSLVEQVRYPPQSGQYKVYIIDEVHILSQAAFNAFLKTLEEPPSYAIFILATTEKHKVIPTILSRCQIFDFQRIQPLAIVQQLQTIAAKENIPCEEEGLHLISQKADGALRDALAMFDLIVTFGSGKLTYQAALENLHVLDYTYYFKLIGFLTQNHIADALLLYDEILRTGFDNLYFIAGLSDHLRNLLVCKDKATLTLLEVPPSIQTQYQEQAKQTPASTLLQALQVINQYDIHYKESHHKRLHIELCLMELAQILGSAHASPANHAPSQPTPTQQIPSNTTHQTPVTTTTPQQPIQTDPPTKIEASTKAGASAKIDTSANTQASTSVTDQTVNKNLESHVAQKQPNAQQALLTTIRLPKLNQIKTDVQVPPTHAATSTPPATPNQQVDADLLQQAWKQYTLQLKEDGKLPAYRLLDQAIELEGATITLQFTNAVQEDILKHIREDLLKHLYAALQYEHLEIKGKLVEETKARRPYTAQEKFNYLANKNPQLHLLQKRLNLTLID